MRVTIACPAEHLSAANQLARCISLGPEDDRTYGEATWQDSAGNLYAVASAIVGNGFGSTATSPLVEPEWGCDLLAASAAQQLIRLQQPASPDIISAVFGDDVDYALSVLAITPVPIDL